MEQPKPNAPDPSGSGPVSGPDPDEVVGPRRTCVGCRTTRAASELVRVGRLGDASLAIGRTLPGRGAWLCRATLEPCSERAVRDGGFARAFRTAIPTESLLALRRQVHAEVTKSGSRFVPGTPPARDS